MLAKLVKYDVKKMTTILIYMYAITISLAIITRLINIGKDIQVVMIIGSVFSSLTYAVLVNVIVNTFIHILKVFVTGFYKDQSYLTHTLPVKRSSQLLSKFLAALCVVFISVVVCILTLVIMLYSPELMQVIKGAITTIGANFNMSAGAFVALIVVVLFSQICAIMSMGFTAIVKGYSYNNKKNFKSALWFVAYYMGAMVITLAVAVIVTAINGNISTLFAEKMSQGAFLSVVIVAAIMYVVYAVVYYFICQKIFKKGVNVD